MKIHLSLAIAAMLVIGCASDGDTESLDAKPADTGATAALTSTVNPVIPSSTLGTGLHQIAAALEATGERLVMSDFSPVEGMPHKNIAFESLPGGSNASLIGDVDALRIASVSFDDVTAGRSTELLDAFAGAFGAPVKEWSAVALKATLADGSTQERTIDSTHWVMTSMGKIVTLRGEAK